MSARQQGNITDRCLKAAEEESRNPRGARIPKRRRDDDVTFTQSQFSRVPPTKYNRSTLFDDMQEKTFQFDTRQRLTELPTVDNRLRAPNNSAPMDSYRFPLIESCTLQSLPQFLEFPRFANVPQQPSLFQSLHQILNSNSISSLSLFDMPLSQYPMVQDPRRAHHVYDEANSLGALVSSLRDNHMANSINNLSLQAPSLALMHHVRNTLGNVPAGDNVNGEENGSFRLAQSLHSVKGLSTVSNQTQDSADQNQSKLFLYIPDDDVKLNENQIFLRQNIELFRATENDILCLTRGKNKPIVLHQVGIRCCHCSHVPVGGRKKGATYFPSNLMGLYQAAQNLGVEHLQSGLCTELPPDVRERFAAFASGKRNGVSGAGKKYWAEAGRMMGLIDTDDGIRFASDRVDGKQTRESADYVGRAKTRHD